MNAFGQELRRIREDRKMSQDELAEKCGTTQGNIGHLENGRQRPKAETLYAISRALGVDCRHWERFFGEPTPPAKPKRKK